MTYPLLADLSDGQAQCPRHVGQHLAPKENARILRMSHPTVHHRMDSARRKLNAQNRKGADRIVMPMERAGAGPCGGGKSGVFRIDVGPKVRTHSTIAKS